MNTALFDVFWGDLERRRTRNRRRGPSQSRLEWVRWFPGHTLRFVSQNSSGVTEQRQILPSWLLSGAVDDPVDLPLLAADLHHEFGCQKLSYDLRRHIIEMGVEVENWLADFLSESDQELPLSFSLDRSFQERAIGFRQASEAGQV